MYEAKHPVLFYIAIYIAGGKKRYNNFSFFYYRAALGCMLLGGGDFYHKHLSK